MLSGAISTRNLFALLNIKRGINTVYIPRTWKFPNFSLLELFDLHTQILPIIIVIMVTVAAAMIGVTIMMILLLLLMAAPSCSQVLSAFDGLSLSIDTAVCCWSAYRGWSAR